MRVTAAVASCIGVGLVLQGCGGGEKGTTCLSEGMDIVSQSLSGNMDIVAVITKDGQDMPGAAKVPFEVKFDFEKLNMWGKLTGPDGSTSNLILSVEKKKVIGYTDAAGDKQCVFADIPDNEVIDSLPFYFTTLKAAAAKQANCGGNDGTYDTWELSKKDFNADIPADSLPINISQLENVSLAGLSIKDGAVSEAVQMDVKGLLHSSTSSVSGSLLNNASETVGSLNMTATLTVDDAKSGGPSEDDLDMSQFEKGIKCKNVTNISDILPDSPFQTQFLRFALAAKDSVKSSEQTLVV